MIAAVAHVTQATGHWWQNLTFGAFDLVLLAVLAFGFWFGRKRGMSREVLPLCQAIVTVLGGALGYEFLAQYLMKWGVIRSVFGATFNEHTAAAITSYLVIALVVFIVFSLLKNRFREKLSGSNAFGSGEYYLGMIAGVVRFFFILLFFLALLNAPFYSAAEIAAAKAYNNRWYGGGMKDFSGDFFPSLQQVQSGVFVTSISGPAIKQYLGELLIEGAAPAQKKPPIVEVK
jgi:uncharacterized membrane protein required for colicin V production